MNNLQPIIKAWVYMCDFNHLDTVVVGKKSCGFIFLRHILFLMSFTLKSTLDSA